MNDDMQFVNPMSIFVGQVQSAVFPGMAVPQNLPVLGAHYDAQGKTSVPNIDAYLELASPGTIRVRYLSKLWPALAIIPSR